MNGADRNTCLPFPFSGLRRLGVSTTKCIIRLVSKEFHIVSCTFNRVSHQQIYSFCMKRRGEKRYSFRHQDTSWAALPRTWNTTKLPAPFISSSLHLLPHSCMHHRWTSAMGPSSRMWPPSREPAAGGEANWDLHRGRRRCGVGRLRRRYKRDCLHRREVLHCWSSRVAARPPLSPADPPPRRR